jgi:rhodanese-related sulfurtransferase
MREPKRVILESLLIVVIGTAVGLTANAMNPKGLELCRDYFLTGSNHGKRNNSSQPAAGSVPANPGANGNGATQTRPVAGDPEPATTAPDLYAGLSPEIRKKLEHFKLKPIRHEELKSLFENPFYQSGLYMIIDAREDSWYAAGHIPGAYHLDYFLDEQTLDQLYATQVQPFVAIAEKVIVYCNGGDCDDSVNTAERLCFKYMVDPGKVFVYPEGFETWQKAGLPVERGVQNSGDIIQASRPAAGGK